MSDDATVRERFQVYGSLSNEKSAVLFEAILQWCVFFYFDSINSPSFRKLFSSNNLANFWTRKGWSITKKLFSSSVVDPHWNISWTEMLEFCIFLRERCSFMSAWHRRQNSCQFNWFYLKVMYLVLKTDLYNSGKSECVHWWALYLTPKNWFMLSVRISSYGYTR